MNSAPSNVQTELTDLTLTEASQLVQRRAVSPVELTQACLARIERLNPVVNAFITVTAEAALHEARQAEAEIAAGQWKGPLHGIPLAIKDLIETAGVRTTAASAVLKDFIPGRDAPVAQKLKAAGAVLLGKLNLHEFAYGGSGMIGYFGIARNPWNTAHIAGGSSSGSASAVAAGLCFGALGTDTAGSIRLPAACCGITGLKPTYGLVSTHGIIPLSWSHDHAGPMTRSVADAARILQAIAGYDPQDTGSREFPPVDYLEALEKNPSSLRLAVPRDSFWTEMDGEVEKAVEEALAILSRLTAETTEISLPLPADRIVFRCEPFVYHEKYLAGHAGEYHPETLRRIRTGANVTAFEYVERYRDLLRQRREIQEIFQRTDLLITPMSPVLPPAIAELEAAPQNLRAQELVMLRNTRPFNVWGLPTISIPCGFSRSGLPIGVQIAGAPGAEDKVLALAQAFERETEWHKRKPHLPE